MIEAELFLLLLIGLLADPVGLDGAGQLPERCADGQIAEVAFALAGGAVLAEPIAQDKIFVDGRRGRYWVAACGARRGSTGRT